MASEMIGVTRKSHMVIEIVHDTEPHEITITWHSGRPAPNFTDRWRVNSCPGKA